MLFRSRRLLPLGALDEYRDPTGTIALAEVALGRPWLGKRAVALEEASGARLAFITRYGEPLLPGPDTVLQEGDLVHALLRDEARERIERIFEHGSLEA